MGLLERQIAPGLATPSSRVATSQTQALGAAKATSEAIGQSRLQMSLALSPPVPYPLILIVVGWAIFVFCGVWADVEGPRDEVGGDLSRRMSGRERRVVNC
jgi:hypothetical protein